MRSYQARGPISSLYLATPDNEPCDTVKVMTFSLTVQLFIPYFRGSVGGARATSVRDRRTGARTYESSTDFCGLPVACCGFSCGTVDLDRDGAA